MEKSIPIRMGIGKNTRTTWVLNGKRHREDGPAVKYPDGHKEWYLNGNCLTFEEFFEQASDKSKEKLLWRLDEL